MVEKTNSGRRLKAPTREVFVWLYVIALALLAAGAWALFTHGDAPHAKPQLPWWAVALGFACAEICVVHVRFRRSAHSFSLADLPFVFGLVFAMDHPQTWVGLYAASLSSGALTILLLSAAIQIAEGSLKRENMAQMFATDA